MAASAQEEFDRYFHSNSSTSQPHPHDRHDPENFSSHSPRSSFEEDPMHNNKMLPADQRPMGNYHIPRRQFEANTGPKGVISDAQSYSRAKQSTFRRAFTNITNTISGKPLPWVQEESKASDATSSLSSSSHGDLDIEEEGEDEFMREWRAKRLAELHTHPRGNRRASPSQRSWGYMTEVDANGYLDAIEKVADDVLVLVCIFDHESARSAAVEAELSDHLAPQYPTTRFVKLHHDVAEMTHVDVPAILAYRGAEVVATLSGVSPDGLENRLLRQGILS